jgi:hypothetical protein
VPLDWHNTGEIDQDVFLLESVVSVQDNGKWVADIDVILMEENRPDVIEKFSCDQNCASRATVEIQEDFVLIDSWEEFLDPPPCGAVFRANGNWVARLAVASILCQQGKGYIAVMLGDDRICWRYLEDVYAEPEPHMPQLIVS